VQNAQRFSQFRPDRMGGAMLTDRLLADEPKTFQDFLRSLDCDDAECHAF
jgi:hypothetical protein